MLRLGILAAAAALAASGQDAFPLAGIQVQGNSRFTQEAVARASGLTLEQTVTPKDFEAACNRLAATGFFEGARYQFKPAAGRSAYELTLVVSEVTDLYDVHIDVPGIDEAKAWQWLLENDGLAQPRGPTSTAAIEYYKAAIERYLEQQGHRVEVAPHLRADPNTAAVVAIFRPAALTGITAVRFEGNRAVDSAALEKAIAPTIGAGYTEQDFRQVLELNIRPLYEEQGRYRVEFSRIAFENGIVSVSISEGPVYTLGEVQVAGERLPVPPEELARLAAMQPGQPPSQRRISQAVSAIVSALGRFGYLDASCEADRNLDDAKGCIDLMFSVYKGPQFAMGELKLSGLDPQSESRARSLWTLARGAVLNLAYVDRYERLLMRDDRIRFKRISRRYERRAGENTADVVFTFRPSE